MKKRIYKIVAALLALCLPLGGALGALAEQDKPDVVGDLLRYFMGVNDGEPEPITDDDGEYVVEGAEEDEGSGSSGLSSPTAFAIPRTSSSVL